MSLRTKTLLATCLTLAVLFAVLVSVLSRILLTGYATVEENETREDVRRVLDTAEQDSALLELALLDWAEWDDTYDFVADQNDHYRTSNLTDANFARLRLNLITYVDQSGRTVFGTGFDRESGKRTPLPPELAAYLSPSGPLLGPEQGARGLLPLGREVMRVAVLPTSGQGTRRGTLIWGRTFDSGAVKRLGEVTHFDISAFRWDDPAAPADVRAAHARLLDDAASGGAQDTHAGAGRPLSARSPIAVRPLDDDIVSGYTMLRDVQGRPVLTLRVDVPRDVMREGRVSLRDFIIALLAAGLVYAVLSFALLSVLVLRPLGRLSADVGAIGERKDFGLRVTVRGRDELARLAGVINETLDALQSSLAREERLEKEVRELRIEIDHSKRAREVERITGSDYFHDLQNKARSMRERGRTPRAEPSSEGTGAG